MLPLVYVGEGALKKKKLQKRDGDDVCDRARLYLSSPAVVFGDTLFICETDCLRCRESIEQIEAAPPLKME